MDRPPIGFAIGPPKVLFSASAAHLVDFKSARSISTSRMSTVCGLLPTTALSTFAPFGTPADCRMIDSNPGAGIDDDEATHDKSASCEGINVSIWAN